MRCNNSYALSRGLSTIAALLLINFGNTLEVVAFDEDGAKIKSITEQINWLPVENFSCLTIASKPERIKNSLLDDKDRLTPSVIYSASCNSLLAQTPPHFRKALENLEVESSIHLVNSDEDLTSLLSFSKSVKPVRLSEIQDLGFCNGVKIYCSFLDDKYLVLSTDRAIILSLIARKSDNIHRQPIESKARQILEKLEIRPNDLVQIVDTAEISTENTHTQRRSNEFYTVKGGEINIDISNLIFTVRPEKKGCSLKYEVVQGDPLKLKDLSKVFSEILISHSPGTFYRFGKNKNSLTVEFPRKAVIWSRFCLWHFMKLVKESP